ncbi:MAG: malectin domain-containing carbohydrate-binding protein [Opitutaceae bacterium]
MRDFKMLKVTTIFITFILIATSLVAAGDFFSDNLNITIPTPERVVRVETNAELRLAISSAQPGDEILLANGSYNGMNLVGLKGASGRPIVFRAEVPLGAVISGSTAGRNIRLSDCEHLEFHGLKLSGADVWGLTMGPAYSSDTSSKGCHSIRVVGCEIEQAGQLLLKVNGNSSNIQILGNTLHDSGQSGYGNPYAEGIYIGDGSLKNDRSHDVLVQGNHLYNIGNQNNWGEAIDIKVTVYNIRIIENLIENVTVYSQGAITVLINNTAYPQDGTNPNVEISRNIIRNVRRHSGGWNGTGMTIGSNGVRVESNLIWDTEESSITVIKNASNTTGASPIYGNTLWGGLIVNESSLGSANRPVAVVQSANLIYGGGASAADYAASAGDFVGPITGEAAGTSFMGSGFILREDSAARLSAVPPVAGSYDLLGRLKPSGFHNFGAFEDLDYDGNFYVPEFEVSFDVSVGGYLVGESLQLVAEGESSSAITAIAMDGYVFDGWSGDFSSQENPLILSDVRAAISLRAEFSLIQAEPEFVEGEVVEAINCAGQAYVSSSGIVYSADKYYVGGKTASRQNAIEGTEDDALYQSERYGEFSYRLPLANGDYTVELKFSETYWSADLKRVFDVFVEQQMSIEDLDIYQEVGENAAFSILVPVYLRDGVLDINLTASADKAKLSAIEVKVGIDPSLLAQKPLDVRFLVSGNGSIEGDTTQTILSGESTTPVTARPDAGYRFTGWVGDFTGGQNTLVLDNVLDDVEVTANFEAVLEDYLYAINSGGSAYTSDNGIVYSADRYYVSGNKGKTNDTVNETQDDTVYRSYRFGTYDYEFPVDDGEYLVVLKMLEPYWNQANRRIFDVKLEGETRIDDLDIYSLHGHDTAYDQSFLVSVTDGSLSIKTSSIQDHAVIAAILIYREGLTIEATGGEAILGAEQLKDATLDSDGDGIVNLLEHAFQSDPLDVLDAGLKAPKLQMATVDGELYLEFSFRRIRGGEGALVDEYTADGVTYRVECSSSLGGEWVSGAEVVTQVGAPVDNGDGTETVTVRAVQSNSEATSMFMRLNVTSL